MTNDINWGQITAGQSASRHLGGQGLGDFGVWRCPACGTEQATAFGDGCQTCGAGKPGQHVGVPPSPSGQIPPLRDKNFRATTMTKSQRDGFTMWVEHMGFGTQPMLAWELLEAAFIAGVVHEQRETHGMLRTSLVPRRQDPTPMYTVDGARARTIAAALQHFRDTLYQGAEEEVASGEWVDPATLQQMIAEFQAGSEIVPFPATTGIDQFPAEGR